MLGLSPTMRAALRDAPVKWVKVPEPFKHARATLTALEMRHLIDHRIRDDGYFEWRSTVLGRNLRTVDAALTMESKKVA